jgi:hypothetical protein
MEFGCLGNKENCRAARDIARFCRFERVEAIALLVPQGL